MISEKIKRQINKALKERDKLRVETLRMLSSALNYERIAQRRDLKKEDEIKVVKSEAKKRKDAIEAYKKAGATEKTKREEQELEILKEFLPEEMSDEELEKIVSDSIKETGAKNIKDMGKVIGKVMERADGRVEGGRVAEAVKNKLA